MSTKAQSRPRSTPQASGTVINHYDEQGLRKPVARPGWRAAAMERVIAARGEWAIMRDDYRPEQIDLAGTHARALATGTDIPADYQRYAIETRTIWLDGRVAIEGRLTNKKENS